LIENSTDLVAVLKEDGEISYTSPSVIRLLGYQPEEIIGKNVLSYLHFQDQALVIAALTPGVPEEQIGKFVEVRLRHRDGTWRCFEANGFELKSTPAINGTVVNCRDITDRKNVEALLQESMENLEQQVVERTEELLRTSTRLNELVLHSPVVIYTTTLKGNWKSIQVSDNVDKLLGYSASQIQDEDGFWDQHIHPEDKRWVRVQKGKIADEKRITCKYRMLHRDGKYRWIRDDMQMAVEEDGLRINLVGSWLDITNQIEAEKDRLSTQERYLGLYESMMDAFVRVDMTGRIIEFNQAYADMLDYTPDELYQLTYVDLTPPKWHAMEAEIVNNEIILLGFSDVYEKEYIRKDGTTFSIDLRTSLTRDENGNPESMWAIVRDITQRKINETALQNAKEELEKRVKERTIELVESQERLRHLTRETITTQEEERRSVSRELHDEVGQVFVTLKYSLDTALGEVPEGYKDLKGRLETAMQITDSSMQLMRDLSHRLRPPILEVGGIHISLEDLCQDVAGKTKLNINYQGVEISELPNEIAISLYRVAQESLTNILKYANAKKVLVKLKYHKGKIQLIVKDDGSGLKNSNTRGTGLLGLQERMNLLGGHLQIESPPGGGVLLKASIPWQKETVD
jgi:PAS domain S-box-containing protein